MSRRALHDNDFARETAASRVLTLARSIPKAREVAVWELEVAELAVVGELAVGELAGGPGRPSFGTKRMGRP